MRRGCLFWSGLALTCTGCPTAEVSDDDDVVLDDDDATDDDDDLPDLPEAAGLSPYAEMLRSVPWLAPPPKEASEYTEILTNGGGAGLIDLDADGVLDLILTACYGDVGVFMNIGEDGWSGRPSTSLEGVTAYAVSVADLDADGRRDLLLGEAGALRMYPGTGDPGQFGDPVTLLDVGEFLVVGVTISDWDGDDLLDLHVSGQAVHRSGEPVLPGSEYMLRGTGPAAFEDVSERFGTEDDRGGQPFATTWLDVDLDGDLDLYVVKDRGQRLVPNRLYLNPGPAEPDGLWEEAAETFGLAAEVAGMGAAAGDVDLDGTTEVAFSDNDSVMHLLSMRSGVAVDVASSWGVALSPDTQESCWGVDLPDVDNDGDLDLVFACGRREYQAHLMQGQNGLHLYDYAAGGFADGGELLDQELTDGLEAWRGVLATDVDADGTLELLFTPHVGYASLQVTEPNANRWLQVALEGPETNPDGLGSQVHITAYGRTRTRVIGAGHTGLASVTEPIAHFGLGGVEMVEEVKVVWPDGSETKIQEDVQPDQRIRIARD